MDLLKALAENKGTVSSEFGKELAARVLAGDGALLERLVGYCVHELADKKARNVRAGAAKAVELVSMDKPELVAPHLAALLPALEAAEPQTRWMIFRTVGCCAALAPDIAAKALPAARDCIRRKKAGQLCLVSSADLYLGDYGAVAKERAAAAFPILLESCDNAIDNEHDWILEAFIAMAANLTKKQKEEAARFACGFAAHPRKKTVERVETLLELIGKAAAR